MAKAKPKTKGGGKAKRRTGANTPTDTPKRDKRENLKPAWQPGQSGNPQGKPKGARNKLCHDFIVGLQTCWDEGGMEAMRKVMQENPLGFMQAVGKLVPQQFGIDEDTGGFLEVMKALGAASSSKDE
ncbi:MAG: hypothetical protein JSS20_12805 [Proteobacteria bacterium]|nr:hypothetical protein [Pseudomonadota bacterium]